MATERVSPSVNIQTTPAADDPVAAAQRSKAGQLASGFDSVQRTAEAIGQIGVTYLRDQALTQAKEDAAGIVKYDADGNLIVPKSFDNFGGGLLYTQAYNDAAKANYKQAALKEVENRATLLAGQFPTDPDALSAKFLEYTDAKIKQMPEEVRPIMQAHFESVRAQAVTGAAANRQKVVNEVTMKNAQDLQAAQVDEWARFKSAEANGTFDPGTLAQHKAKLDDKWKDYVALATQAGVPQVAIDRQYKLMLAQADARNFFKGIEASVGGAGESAAAAFGARQSDIEAFQKKYPGADYQQVIGSEMQAAMSRANARSSGTVNAQNVLANQYTAEEGTIRRQWAEARANVTKNPDDYPDQQAALAEINQIYEGQLNVLRTRSAYDNNLRPLQRAQIALSALTVRDQMTHTMLSTAVATQMGTLQSATSTQLERSNALGDLQSFLKNPETIAYGLSSPQGASLIRTAQHAVGNAYIQSSLGNISNFKNSFNGEIPPEKMEPLIAEAQRRNYIGTDYAGQVNPAEIPALIQKNRDAYQKKQLAGITTAETITNWKSGTTTANAAQQKQVRDTIPFSVSAYNYGTGRVETAPFNGANPGHISAALSYTAATGVVPEQIAEYLAKAPGIASPEERKHMLSVGQSFQTLFDNHYKGRGITMDERKERVAAQMRSQLGDGYRMMIGIAREGYEADPSRLNKYNSGELPNRENPGKPDETRQQIIAELQGRADMAKNQTKALLYSAGSGLLGEGTVLNDLLGRSDVSKMEFMSKAGQQEMMAGIAGRSFLTGNGIQPDKTIELSGDVVDDVVGHAQKFKDQWGKSIKEGENLDPNRQAVHDYFIKYEQDLALREVTDARGNVQKYVLERKPFHVEANGQWGTKLTQNQWTDLATARARMTRPDLFQGPDPVDPSSVRIVSGQREDGSKIHGLYGNTYRNRSMVYIGDIDPRDQSMGYVSGKVFDQVYREMGDHNLANLFSNMPIFGKLIEQKIAENVTDAMVTQAGDRQEPNKAWTNFLLTLRTAIKDNSALSHFAGEKYDAAWQKAATADAERAIVRFGGPAYLMGFSSPRIPGITPVNDIETPDSPPSQRWWDNVSPAQQQGMEDSRKALEQSRNANRGSRRQTLPPIDPTAPPDNAPDQTPMSRLTPEQSRRPGETNAQFIARQRASQRKPE